MCILGEKIEYACVLKQILLNSQQSNLASISAHEIVRFLQNLMCDCLNWQVLSVVFEKSKPCADHMRLTAVEWPCTCMSSWLSTGWVKLLHVQIMLTDWLYLIYIYLKGVKWETMSCSYKNVKPGVKRNVHSWRENWICMCYEADFAQFSTVKFYMHKGSWNCEGSSEFGLWLLK